MTELGTSLLSRCATMISPSGESKEAEVGVRTISAPRARNTSTFSFDIFSGITMMQRYPFTAATIAKPRPKTTATLVGTQLKNISNNTERTWEYILFIYVLVLDQVKLEH
jgi:hypothetical protein